MDFHAHLSTNEVIGVLAGRYDPHSRLLQVLQAFPVSRTTLPPMLLQMWGCSGTLCAAAGLAAEPLYQVLVNAPEPPVTQLGQTFPMNPSSTLLLLLLRMWGCSGTLCAAATAGEP